MTMTGCGGCGGQGLNENGKIGSYVLMLGPQLVELFEKD